MNVSSETALAISHQKARYARYADTKQWEKFEKEVSCPDTQWDFRDVDGRTLVAGKTALKFSSSKEMRAFFEPFFANLQTLHNFGPGDLTQTEKGDEVEAVWGFEDQLISPALGSWAEIRGGGYYYETWKLIDGEWRLKSLRMQRNYQKMTALVSLAMFLQKFGISVM